MNYNPSTKSFEYKCPYEGKKCELGKHCHVIETTQKLNNEIEAWIMCKVKHEKIRVTVGA